MTNELLKIELSPEQKSHVTGVLSVGCDRETAANMTGQSPAEFARALQFDPVFAAEVRRTEAAVELLHMRKIHQAAQDEKNWRISVWWLEQRSPERFAARSPGAVTTRHLKAFVEFFGESLANDIRNPEDRDRVQTRLEQLGALCRQLDDDGWETPDAKDNFAAERDLDTAVDETNASSGSLPSTGRVREG